MLIHETAGKFGCFVIVIYYNECKNSMRNNGSKANAVMPVDISATVIPRPISDLKNTLINLPPLAFCLL